MKLRSRSAPRRSGAGTKRLENDGIDVSNTDMLAASIAWGGALASRSIQSMSTHAPKDVARG